jgi:RNase P protein component
MHSVNDDLKGKSSAELQAMFDECVRRQAITDKLDEFVGTLQQRLAAVARNDVKRRFQHWMHNVATIHQLQQAYFLVLNRTMDMEAFLREHDNAAR